MLTTTSPPAILDIVGLSHRYRVSESVLRRLESEGAWPAPLRLGRRRVYLPSDVDRVGAALRSRGYLAAAAGEGGDR